MRALLVLLLFSFAVPPPPVDMWVDSNRLVWVTADPTVPVLTIEFYRSGEPFMVDTVAESYAQCVISANTVTCTPTDPGIWMLAFVGLRLPPGAVVYGRAFSGSRIATAVIFGPPGPIYLPLIQRPPAAPALR
jgi:hypothetical protein